MREIVLDTETTGLDPAAGHRIVEIAGLELLHHVPTGRTFREYINPERDVPPEAERIHGLSAEFLKDKPVFKAIAQAFVDFIGDARLIIHNAAFDIKFLNAELTACGLTLLPTERAICTVTMARQRFPGAQVSLDALCRRFEIDNSARTFHGALLDCELLAEVYLELCGGRQPGLVLETRRLGTAAAIAPLAREARPPRIHPVSPEEEAAHAAMLEKLSNPVWRA
jgi:DNA polymerase III subunit epsilon